MPQLSEREKLDIYNEVLRSKQRTDRSRKRPDYKTISVRTARRLGYEAVTTTYSIRQFDQCEMLNKVIADFNGVDIKLVRMGERNNLIEVWRKR